MAQSYLIKSLVSINDTLAELNTLLTRSGSAWTVDYFGSYNGNNRIHFHKDNAHFEFWYGGATTINMAGCTGYESGSAPGSQPGTSSTTYTWGDGAGKDVAIIDVVDSVYIGLYRSDSTWGWSAAFIVSSKIGSWTGGHGISAGRNLGLIISGGGSNQQLYINGSWTSADPSNNCLTSTWTEHYPDNNFYSTLAISQPCRYNGAIIPHPIVLFVTSADGILKLPVGYAPGISRFLGGDVYSYSEIIPAAGKNFLAMPCYGITLGRQRYADLLFEVTI